MCAYGSKIVAFATTTLYYISPATDAKEGVLLMWPAPVSAFLVFVAGTIMSTGCECQGTRVRFARNIPHMYMLMNDVPNNESNTELSTTPNQTRMCRSFICRCNRITTSELTG